MIAVTLTLALIVALAFINVQVYTLFSIQKPEEKPEKPEEYPLVSLLLAARNEEQNIERCLEALTALDYPDGRLEILVGDDNSSDRTFEIAARISEQHHHVKLISIKETMGLARGKANVLAHLAKEASGEIFLITDADVAVPEQWARAMVGSFTPEVGIVSGTTTCARGRFFETMQSIDWLHFMGYIKAFANAGRSCTAVGNNMAVRAEAYSQTGGFENLKFSITADYRLFQAVTAIGWKWYNNLDSNTLGVARPITGLKELLHQRKRWLIGARDLSLFWKTMLLLYVAFTPALFAILVVNPNLGFFVWFVKFFLQVTFISVLIRRTESRHFRLSAYLLYELFVLINSPLSAMFYLLPVATIWKGRVYSSTDLLEEGRGTNEPQT